MDKTLYLIRGLPGSGKSTLANALTPHVFEADQWRERSGEYVFNPAESGDAHADCQRRARAAMADGLTPVAVANTMVKAWEARPYIAWAAEFGYSVFVIECQNAWPNVHDVPDHAIDRMRGNWEPLR
jgi:predicted kinase